MSGEFDDLLHGGVLPDEDLVLAVAVGADQLTRVLGPGQITHLAPCVH